MDETVVLSESKEILFSAQLFRASQIDMSSSKVEWYFLNTTRALYPNIYEKMHNYNELRFV